MSTAIAQPVQTLKTFLGNSDCRHVTGSTNREVPSGTEATARPAACGTKSRQRLSFLTALLRSFAVAAA